MGIPVPGVSVFKQFRNQRSDYDGSAVDESGAAPFSREALSAWVARESTKFPEEDGVLVLGGDSLDDAMAEYGTLLLEFYAPVRAPPSSHLVCACTRVRVIGWPSARVWRAHPS